MKYKSLKSRFEGRTTISVYDDHSNQNNTLITRDQRNKTVILFNTIHFVRNIFQYIQVAPAPRT